MAEKIGINASTLGRIESGKTQTISNEIVQALARVFDVSTDYLLGIANTPDKKNYDIGELGLSVQAAKNLYTGKVNAEVVSRLLEQPRFATLTQMMAQYLDGTLAEGVAAQNQIISSVSELLLGQTQIYPDKKRTVTEAARAVGITKTPPYQADLTSIQNTFSALLKEMKAESQTDLSMQKKMTKGIFDQVVAGLSKGQNDPSLHAITPEQMVNAITGTIVGMDGVTDDQLQGLKAAMMPLFQKPAREDSDGSIDE